MLLAVLYVGTSIAQRLSAIIINSHAQCVRGTLYTTRFLLSASSKTGHLTLCCSTDNDL